MVVLTMLIFALHAPVNCPPEVGQIRWDGVQHTLTIKGKRVAVRGTVWDRDRDGKPSHKDLMRIDSASGFGVDELWIELRGNLAKDIARSLKSKGSAGQRCESRFTVDGVPKVGTARALARLIAGTDGGGGKLTLEDRVRGDMAGWAEQMCGGKTHIGEEQLAQALEARGKRAHSKAGAGTLRRVAHQVAADYSLKCAHLEVGKGLTFD